MPSGRPRPSCGKQAAEFRLGARISSPPAREDVAAGLDGGSGASRRVAEAAVGHEAGDAPHHEARDQDRAGRGGARVLAAVHREHRTQGTLAHVDEIKAKDPGYIRS